jgi:hypothetical protein
MEAQLANAEAAGHETESPRALVGGQLATDHRSPVASDRLLPAVYDETAAFRVVEQIAFGRSMHEIARLPGMPKPEDFVHWLMLHPELGLAVSRAREVSAFVMEDEALDLTRAAVQEGGAPSATALRALELLTKQLQWSAVKRNPQVYSEKSAVQVTVPIQINTSLDMGHQDKRQGTAQFPNIYALKAENIVEVEHSDMAPEPEPPAPKGRKRVLTPAEAQDAETAARQREVRELAKRATRVDRRQKDAARKAAAIQRSLAAGETA